MCVYKRSNLHKHLEPSASEHLHPSHFRLARWQITNPCRECQQNKLYKSWIYTFTGWGERNVLQRGDSLNVKPVQNPKVARNVLRNDTLPSQSAKGAFLSIVSGLKKLCDSINWGKRSLNFITLLFPQAARRSAAPQPKCDKRRQKFYTQARRGWPSRPFIFSYLFIPGCKFMRILLSFQLWLLPPLDEEEKKNEQRPRLGLGVFLLPPQNWLSMRGQENLNYSACEAMAPPSGLEPLRMCPSFPLFQLGHARKNFIQHGPDPSETHCFPKWAPGESTGCREGVYMCPHQNEGWTHFTLLWWIKKESKSRD